MRFYLRLGLINGIFRRFGQFLWSYLCCLSGSFVGDIDVFLAVEDAGSAAELAGLAFFGDAGGSWPITELGRQPRWRQVVAVVVAVAHRAAFLMQHFVRCITRLNNSVQISYQILVQYDHAFQPYVQVLGGGGSVEVYQLVKNVD